MSDFTLKYKRKMNNTDTQSQDSEYILVLVPVLVRKRDMMTMSMASIPLPSLANPAPLPSEPSLTQMVTANQQPSPMANQRRKEWPHQGMATSKQIDLIKRLARERNMSNKEILQMIGVESFDQFTNANAHDAIKHLKSIPQF